MHYVKILKLCVYIQHIESLEHTAPLCQNPEITQHLESFRG